MPEVIKFQNETYLKDEQYKNSANLTARSELHRRFSTAVINWPHWVFSQLALEPNSRVLECGCGPGWLWRHNEPQIPANCHITLTDLSVGMVAEAEAALKNSQTDFHFQPANMQQLPFPEHAFDVVVANHMLYHVPDFEQALAEVRRVLPENGRFYAATNGKGHLRELWQLAEQMLPELEAEDERWHLPFSLENGAELLRPYFSKIERREFEDKLVVTEAEPIVAYLNSSAKILEISVEKWQQMLSFLQEKIDRSGSIIIRKETGLFVCQ